MGIWKQQLVCCFPPLQIVLISIQMLYVQLLFLLLCQDLFMSLQLRWGLRNCLFSTSDVNCDRNTIFMLLLIIDYHVIIKVVAANMVRTDRSLSGTHLLCAVGRHQEACSQVRFCTNSFYLCIQYLRV